MSPRKAHSHRGQARGSGPAKTPTMDLERIAKAVREILLAVGEDPDRQGLRDTPMRVARMYAEVFAGLHQKPAEHLAKYHPETYDGIVVLRDIPFHSMCEHHLVPFVGRCHVAYRPRRRVAGLSRLARVVETFAHRPQLQERLTLQIADLLMKELNAEGVVVVMEATHTCMTIRGSDRPGSEMVTSVFRGVFERDVRQRETVLKLFGR
jgi:GTP cyclohydrolase I